MFKATITRISLPYGSLLTKIFKLFKIDLNNEKKRTPKSISDEYNEKTLKSKWTPKSTKKPGKGSASKKKTPSGSSFKQMSAKKVCLMILRVVKGR